MPADLVGLPVPCEAPWRERPIVNPWIYLIGAIAFEIGGTLTLKSTEGFSRLWPSVLCALAYAASFRLLASALKGIEVGVAYAIWSAVGTAVVAGFGVAFWDESFTAPKVLGVALVVAGVVLLNIGTVHGT